MTSTTTSSPKPKPNIRRIIREAPWAGKLALRRRNPLPILAGLDADVSRRVRAHPAARREAGPLPGERAWRDPQGSRADRGPGRPGVPRGLRDRTVAPGAADPL